jgi:hypothetical protein
MDRIDRIDRTEEKMIRDFRFQILYPVRPVNPVHSDFSEPELNTLGYELLGAGRVAEAVEIFKLNVEMFPEAFNAYDSLGEAYAAAGD